MKKLALSLLVVGLWGLSQGGLNPTEAQAQVGYVTYYQPVTVYRPAAAYQPAPVVYSSYYAGPPVVAAPAPVYHPVARVRTRYRPILGGTVTRITPGYQAYYPPVPVAYGY